MTEIAQIGNATLYHGDCREIMPILVPIDVTVTDPPYGVTLLAWDKVCDGWLDLVPSQALWLFGSMSFFRSQRFEGWKYSQEIIWEKHNGSNFHADRFRRVHEIAMMFYRGAWETLYKRVPETMDATRRTVRRKEKPAHHLGARQASHYVSEDGGPRKMRSVIYARSCHGSAVHPTQKPVDIVRPLCEYSCPPAGVVLDPFMGSGTTAAVARRNGCRAIGIELNADYCQLAANRLRQGTLFSQ